MYHELKDLLKQGFISFPLNVKFVPRYSREERRWLMILPLGDLPPNTTAEYPLVTFQNINLDIAREVKFLNLPLGPIIRYKTAEGIKGATIAGGIAYPITPSGTLIHTTVDVETPEGRSFVTIDDVVKVTVNFTSYGNLPAKDIHYEIWHAIVDERGNFLEIEKIGEGYLEELGTWNSNYYNEVFDHYYTVRTRPGLHVVGVVYDYNATFMVGDESFEFRVHAVSNFVTMFVLPPARVRGNIFRYPLPHAELEVTKEVTYDNTTGAFNVRITIKNVGDIPTNITLIADYWNGSLVQSDYKAYINGTEVTAAVYLNKKINVLYVAPVSPWNNVSITLQPNETIVIEYKLYPKVAGTFELISNPTLVIYDFGPYEMLDEEGPHGTEAEQQVEEAALRIAQATGGSQQVQTYTDALILTASVAGKPRVREGVILLLGILIVGTLGVAVALTRRKRVE